MTRAETQAARENPRVGDVWRCPERDVRVVSISDYGNVTVDNGCVCDHSLWLWWTENYATLVKRGGV